MTAPSRSPAIRTRWCARSSIARDAGTRPLRLPLGSDTYALVKRAPTDRLAALEAAKEIAFPTDG